MRCCLAPAPARPWVKPRAGCARAPCAWGMRIISNLTSITALRTRERCMRQRGTVMPDFTLDAQLIWLQTFYRRLTGQTAGVRARHDLGLDTEDLEMVSAIVHTLEALVDSQVR